VYVGTVHSSCVADSAAGNAGRARRRSQEQAELKNLAGSYLALSTSQVSTPLSSRIPAWPERNLRWALFAGGGICCSLAGCVPARTSTEPYDC
jgi:hypothetical protein